MSRMVLAAAAVALCVGNAPAFGFGCYGGFGGYQPQAALASLTESGRLTITCSGPALAFPQKASYTVDGQQRETTLMRKSRQLSQIELAPDVVQVYDARGNKLASSDLPRLLPKERTVFVFGGGPGLMREYLQLLREDTPVLVLPEGVTLQGPGADFGAPAMPPAPGAVHPVPASAPSNPGTIQRPKGEPIETPPDRPREVPKAKRLPPPPGGEHEAQRPLPADEQPPPRAPSPPPPTGKKDRPAVKLSEAETDLLARTNKEREKEGRPALRPSAKLFKAARAHSANLAKHDRLDHTLDGKGPGERLQDVGYESAGWGENCAAGQRTPEEAISSWMNSPGHRGNILNRDYTEIGLGLAPDGRGGFYFTQVFGSPRP